MYDRYVAELEKANRPAELGEEGATCSLLYRSSPVIGLLLRSYCVVQTFTVFIAVSASVRVL